MYGFIGNIGPWELVFILLVALIVVGPGKLPEVARTLGKAANEFRKATTGVRKEFQDALRLDDDTPSQKTKVSSSSQTSVQDSIDISDDKTEIKVEEEHN